MRPPASAYTLLVMERSLLSVTALAAGPAVGMRTGCLPLRPSSGPCGPRWGQLPLDHLQLLLYLVVLREKGLVVGLGRYEYS